MRISRQLLLERQIHCFHPNPSSLMSVSCRNRGIIRLFSSTVKGEISNEEEGDDFKDLTLSKDLLEQLELRNQKVEEITRAWVERVVVGMNLCPFAERPMKDGKLKILVVRGNDLESAIIPILHSQLEKRVELPGTTLGECKS